ncbi:MAG: hypothetical protein ACJ74G_07445 [Blastocatellia bacterium]
MNAKRIFATLTLIALLSVAAAAQSNDRGMLWKKYFGRNAVAVPMQSAAVEAAPQSAAPPADDRQNDFGITATPSKFRLEGTWLATVTFTDGFALKVLFTFMPGRDENEGTLIDSNEFLLTPDPIGAPDQGVWQRTVDRSFIATHLAFLFNSADGSPAGTAHVRDGITMLDNDRFTGRQFVDIYDTNDTLVASFRATINATRIKAQAPPQ